MEKDTIDLRRHKRALRQGRWVIAASVLVFAALAAIYWVHHLPKYDITSATLIEDDEDSGGGATGLKASGGLNSMMRTFSIGGFGGASVDNERVLAESNNVFTTTVRNLGLQRTYMVKDGLKREVLWNNSPVNFEAPDSYFDNLRKGCSVKVQLRHGKADVTVTTGLLRSTFAQYTGCTLPMTINTPGGRAQLMRTQHYSPQADVDLTINVSSTAEMVSYLRKNVEVDLYDKKSDVIEYIYQDPNPERGKALLNELMRNYNQKRIERKNEKAKQNYEFYDTRIKQLLAELSGEEDRFEQFKRDNNVANPTYEQPEYIKQSMTAQKALDSARTSIAMQEMVVKAVRQADEGQHAYIPTYTDDPNITIYNELLDQRQELSQSAKAGNARLAEIDERIASARKAVLAAAEKRLTALRAQTSVLEKQQSLLQTRASDMPGYEKQYLSLMRNQEIKNQLYIFLLQKKENALLTLTSSTSPSFIIDPAYSAVKPDIIKPVVIVLACLLMGLLLPVCLLLLAMRWRDRLSEPCDLPAEWEQCSAVVTSRESSVIALRNQITQLGVGKMLVCGSTEGRDRLLQQIKGSLEAIGKHVTIIAVPHIDDLYTGPVSEAIAESAAKSDLTLVSLPEGATLPEVKDQIADVTGVMAVAHCATMRRGQFSSTIGGADCPRKIAVLI